MLKDIYAGSTTSSPQLLTNVNGVLYFSATDPDNGTELWKSDGTATGTLLVKDIYATVGNASPQALTNGNGILYFSATDAAHGAELWKSDGSAAGTQLIKDIWGGTYYSSPKPNGCKRHIIFQCF